MTAGGVEVRAVGRLVGNATPAAQVALAAALAALSATPIALAAPPAVIGTQPFTDHRNPPPYTKLGSAEAARYDLGMAVFNTQFIVAGTPGAGRRDGVGPLFNAASCDQCHNNGAHGRGPTESGPAPAALVIQLAASASAAETSTDPPGDPVYGRVFNTISLEGLRAEGVVSIRYEDSVGHYPDGSAWSLRIPHYTFPQLNYGPLAAQTVVKPRLAPALFGVGLLDTAVALKAGVLTGHFGWQATALSVADRTARAFSREMGLTSTQISNDDCTPVEAECLKQPNGGSPEVSDDLFDAVVSFQHSLAVPSSPSPHAQPDRDSKVFTQLGCAACHQPQMPVSTSAVIAPYTDLRLHDLGTRLADETVTGEKVSSKWRTAPLWGLGYRVSFERSPTFLHDGRARSVEEAILWHDGEAADARARFEQLPAAQRRAFLHWLETL